MVNPLENLDLPHGGDGEALFLVLHLDALEGHHLPGLPIPSLIHHPTTTIETSWRAHIEVWVEMDDLLPIGSLSNLHKVLIECQIVVHSQEGLGYHFGGHNGHPCCDSCGARQTVLVPVLDDVRVRGGHPQ